MKEEEENDLDDSDPADLSVGTIIRKIDKAIQQQPCSSLSSEADGSERNTGNMEHADLTPTLGRHRRCQSTCRSLAAIFSGTMTTTLATIDDISHPRHLTVAAVKSKSLHY